MKVNYPLVEKYPRVIGSLASRVSLLENKVAITQTAASSTVSGATITFSPTAPTVPPPHVGDLWYNTSNGNLVSQWTGSAWTPYQFGTGGIANNAVTNALLASGSVANSNLQAASVGNINLQGGSVGNSNLQAGSVGNSNLQAYTVGAGQGMAQFFGQNMITDGQFR